MRFFSFLFPENIYCCICGKVISNKYGICPSCIKKLAWTNKNTCEKCGRIIIADKIKFCPDCLKEDHPYEKIFSVCLYDNLTRRIILGLKNKYKFNNAEIVALLIAEKLISSGNITTEDIDYIVPVPLFKKKLSTRGFNQSELICKHLSRHLNIPYEKNILLKNIQTKDTKSLTKNDRLLNLKNAFSISDKNAISKKNILVVDDIFTTGATAETISKLLKENGSGKIYFTTFTTRMAEKYNDLIEE